MRSAIPSPGGGRTAVATAESSLLSVEPRYVWLPLAFSAAVRFLYGVLYWRTIPYAKAPVVDAEIYVDLARGLRAGHWLNPELLYHSFLYPYFLALFPFDGDAFFAAVIAAQLALGVLETWLVMDAAWKIWRDRWTVLFAGAGFTLTTPVFFYESKLYAEGIAVALIALLVWQMANRSRPWRVGLTCGLLILARPDTVLFTAIVLFYAWSVHRPEPRGRRIAGALAAILSCMGVAALRNTLIAGVFVGTPITTSGVAFYLGNNPSAEGGYSQPEEFGSAVVGQSRQAKEFAERELGGPLDPTQVSRYWWKRGLEYLAGDPLHALDLMRQKLQLYLGVHETLLDLGFYAERERLPLLRVLLLPFPALLLLGLAGIPGARAATFERWMPPCLAGAVAPSLIANLLFFSQSRYRVTALIPALLLAAHGMRVLLLALTVPRRAIGAGAALALTAGAIVLAQLKDDDAKDRAVSHYNLGIAYERLGDLDEALAQFERAFAVAAPHPMVRSNYAASLARHGRASEAEALLREGLLADPHSAVLLVDLGHIEFNRKNFEEAERLFLEALRWEPGNVAAKLNTAIILRMRTRDPEALRAAAESFLAVSRSGDVLYARHALLNLGLTYALLGQSSLVDAPYERAAELGPLSSGEEHDWAVSLLTVRRYEDAWRHVERALAIDPGDPNAKRLRLLIEQRLRERSGEPAH